jgi:protein Tex
MENAYVKLIADELGIREFQVQNTITLLEGGATVPFISRYRKEMTGSLDEVVIMAIRDRHHQLVELDKRREAIIASIREQGFLTPELERQLVAATVLSDLEDLYLPYKPKRKTRATIAKSRGLEPLAKLLMAQYNIDVKAQAKIYVDPQKEVCTIEEALAGARDIIAEWINESKDSRARMRHLFNREALISSKSVKGKELEGIKYQSWYEWSEPLSQAPSHRVLALLRGESEGFLKVSVAPDEIKAEEILAKLFVKSNNDASDQVTLALKDSYKRLLQPSMETEVRQVAKEKADTEAIRVFTANLRQLLLAPPLGQKNVLAIDPGFRSGCKVVCLDKQGNLLHNETIYPHPPQSEVKQAMAKIQNLVDAYKIEAIAIGNGTAGRETENFIRRIQFNREIMALMVNESGASVYSASDVARSEFPDYDVTVRGSVSIGRRLMDPLAELVKIDPKSIGVGQYQHDVNQPALQKSLEDVVVSCVNKVGVELNTASMYLLTFVSGIGPILAGNIIKHRNTSGKFTSRDDLKKVARFGEKVFEQSAGFLRIGDALNPLDRSAVHPESYQVVYKMAEDLNCTVADLMQDESFRAKINLADYISGTTGLPTLNDIMQELAKPGRDPRSTFDFFEFDKNVNRMEDLYVGMVLPGIITNITNFGAFVDIGVHQDGLVHISQLRERFTKDPNEVVKLNQKVRVKVLEVDRERKRIQLSMRNVD